MFAVRVEQPGGPEVLVWRELPDPSPGSNEVVVRTEAAGVNFIDTYQRSGRYPVSLPFTAGMEGAGIVEAVGSSVKDFRAGERVAFANVQGAYATKVVVAAGKLVSVPEGVTGEQAAAAMLQGMTAHFLSDAAYPLIEDEWSLLHAGAGGVGLLLTQMIRKRGAHVITTVSTEEKEKLSREAGADEVIRYTEKDFEAEVKRLTDGDGVPVVYDSVGKTTFEKSLACLRRRGTMVLFGGSSGPVPPFDPMVLSRRGSLFLTRPTLGDYTADRASLLARAGDVLGWVASGRLKLRIEHRFSLKDAADAHAALEGRKTTGKVLLIP
ncbi:MAG: quinone oxidoreductase family protein [Myxococcaceae bacterium]